MARTTTYFCQFSHLKNQKKGTLNSMQVLYIKVKLLSKTFDLIDKQEEYDEERLLFYFKRKSTRLDFPSLKVYLYDLFFVA